MIIKMNLILGVVLMLVSISFITGQKEDNSSFTESIISKIKSNDFDKINLKDWLRKLANHENKEETISAYSAIFNELKRRNNVNYNEAVVTLAFLLKDLVNTNLSIKAADEAAQLKAALPESVRNLAFSKQVCIIASDLKQPLYASSQFIKYSNRRKVFTWTLGGRDKQGFWAIEPHNDNYYIRNTLYDEYMYSPSFWHIFDLKRHVYTWMAHGDDGGHPSFNWQFYPIGDLMYIYNFYNKQYLEIQSLHQYDENRTIVFSRNNLVKFEKITTWKIESC